jgi:PEP-CTERM motif
MKTLSATLALLALLSLGAACQAGITDVNCHNDGDGAITMIDWWDNLSNPADADIYMSEALHWAPAHALVDITLDSPEDPAARFTKDVDNETASAWNGYVINVIKNASFSITSATAPAGWDAPIITAPVLQYSGIYAGDYLGTVTYSAGAGTPVAIGDWGEFKLATSFTGNSTFTLEQIPTWDGTSVPEPGTLALLLLGGLCAIAIFKRRK